MITRRKLLTLSLPAALTCGACGGKRIAIAKPPAGALSRPLQAGIGLAPVTVNPAHEIRTITGLRPYRERGFVVRREDHGNKTLVHNYGHGGGGMSLSWGSSHLAIQQVAPVTGKSCAVVGGGVMGLSTARLLQLNGAQVTLYAQSLPPHTTSNVAGAQWWPVSVFEPKEIRDEFRVQFVDAANFSYRYFQNLIGPRWGVDWRPNYFLSDEAPANGALSGPGSLLHHLQVDFRDFGPGEHVLPASYARHFMTMHIQPAVYLEQLLEAVQVGGTRIEVRRFENPEELLRLPHNVIFNCTGLGSKQLFDDQELIPVKGQLTFLLPHPDVRYNLLKGGLYMFPRPDGILLGGSFEKGNVDLRPDPEVKTRVLAGHAAMFQKMAEAQFPAPSRR